METNKRLYVDFHVLQTVPPSCVNRDDTGRPKTAVYGGATRARVSSQSWKHAMRQYFKNIFGEEELGLRTKYAVKLIADKIKELSPDMADEEAEKKAETALTNAGLKVKPDKTTGALFFISAVQAKDLAELVVSSEKDKAPYKEALKSNPSIDVALFGRMAADDVDLNTDAAAQVAHSISTHAVTNEYDYFTAVDDYQQRDDAGAGHLGTMEFNSSTLYRYATVNAAELLTTIGSSTPKAVRGFAEAFVKSMPTGKQNSYANGTLPELIYVAVRTDQPVNLCGAFEKPVRSNEGYVEKSVDKLCEYAEKVYEDYCCEPACAFVVGSAETAEGLKAKKVNINELLENLKAYVEEQTR